VIDIVQYSIALVYVTGFFGW